MLNQIYQNYIIRSNITIIASRPGKGKTTFALYIAELHTNQKQNICFITLEMNKEDFIKRVQENSYLTIIDSIFNIDDIISTIKNCKQTKLFVIDYLQLIGNDTHQNRKLQIEKIMTDLKELATQMNKSIIILTQLNRALESRSDKTPVLSDIRESFVVELADCVIMLEREEGFDIKYLVLKDDLL